MVLLDIGKVSVMCDAHIAFVLENITSINVSSEQNVNIIQSTRLTKLTVSAVARTMVLIKVQANMRTMLLFAIVVLFFGQSRAYNQCSGNKQNVVVPQSYDKDVPDASQTGMPQRLAWHMGLNILGRSAKRGEVELVNNFY